jgi:cyclopropane fatty-acyl-phospholipid synthase-like methyltransferase
MACVACGESLLPPPIVRVGTAQLLTCNRCGVWTYWPRPNESGQAALHDSAEYFEHPYFELRRRGTPQLDQRCRKIFDRVRAADVDVKSLAGQRVLDVGCDTGAFLLSAARQFGIIPVGLDVSARSVQVARDTGVEAYRGRIEEAPAQLRDFPLVTAIDLIEHVTDPRGFLIAIRERLRPGGVVYIETPNIKSAVYAGGAVLCRLTRGQPADLFQRLFPPQHIQYFTVESLAALVRNGGLDVVHLSTRVLPGRDIAASLPVRLGVGLLQLSDWIIGNRILICAVLRRPTNGSLS